MWLLFLQYAQVDLMPNVLLKFYKNPTNRVGEAHTDVVYRQTDGQRDGHPDSSIPFTTFLCTRYNKLWIFLHNILEPNLEVCYHTWQRQILIQLYCYAQILQVGKKTWKLVKRLRQLIWVSCLQTKVLCPFFKFFAVFIPIS